MGSSVLRALPLTLMLGLAACNTASSLTEGSAAAEDFAVGTVRERSLLADARTPAYRTV